MNPYFAPPAKVVSDTIYKHNELATAPLAESAGKMAAAVFSQDTNEHAYVNSTEVFCHKFLAVLFALSVHRNGAIMRVFDTSRVKSVLDEKQFRRFLFDLVDTPTSYIKFG